MFKNLIVFSSGNLQHIADSDLGGLLVEKPLLAPGGAQLSTSGWVPPRDSGAQIFHRVGSHILMACGCEERILPAAAVKRELAIIVKNFEDTNGYKPGSKQRREMKDDLMASMLPRSFIKASKTLIWLNVDSGLICVAATSEKAAEPAISLLRDTFDVTVSLPTLALSPSQAMTNWLINEGVPNSLLTIDDAVDLVSVGASKSQAKFSHHEVLSPEVLVHPTKKGKVVKSMGLTFNDECSFVLNDAFAFKKLALLDVQDDTDHDPEEDADAAFEATFLLESAIYSRAVIAVIKALGGEVLENQS